MFRSIALGLLAFFTALPAAGAPLVQLDVIDREQGRQLPQYQHRSGRWIPGAPGHRYSVQLTNTTGERVLVVLSVDGVNAVTGETASPDQAGYLLGPWQTSQVAGWRKSHQEIAQFVFTSISDSYAARTGRPDNIGVIGIAVYREARRPPQWAPGPPPPAVADRAADAPSTQSRLQQQPGAPASVAAESSSDQQRLGTGHGTREWSPVSDTVFLRGSRTPAQVTKLRYDAGERLVALGVLPSIPRSTDPEPFPARFVADPAH